MSEMVGDRSEDDAAKEPFAAAPHYENVGVSTLADFDELLGRITDLLLGLVVDPFEIGLGHRTIEHVPLSIR